MVPTVYLLMGLYKENGKKFSRSPKLYSWFMVGVPKFMYKHKIQRIRNNAPKFEISLATVPKLDSPKRVR